MATATTTVVTKTVAPAAPSAPKLAWPDLALVAASALVPLLASALGAIPNPATAIAGMVLAAVWAIAKTFLAHKALDKATIESSIKQLEAAFEKATGKTIPADIKSTIEFGAGAVAEASGLTTEPAPAVTPAP